MPEKFKNLALQQAISLSRGRTIEGKKYTHAAICIGQNTTGEPLLASIEEKRTVMVNGVKTEIPRGYKQETLTTLLEADVIQDRAFTVFRIDNPEFKRRLVENTVKDKDEKIDWSIGGAIRMGLFPAAGLLGTENHHAINNNPSTNAVEPSSSDICSSYVMRKLKQSGYETNYDTNVHPSTLAYALQESNLFEVLQHDLPSKNLTAAAILDTTITAAAAAKSNPASEARDNMTTSKNKFEALEKIIDGVILQCQTKDNAPPPIQKMKALLDNHEIMNDDKKWNSLKEIAKQTRHDPLPQNNNTNQTHSHCSRNKRHNLYTAIIDSQAKGIDKLLGKIENRFEQTKKEHETSKNVKMMPVTKRM